MKNLCFLLLFVCNALALSAQPFTRFEKNGKYGFKDAAGKIVVKPTYQSTSYEFSSLGGVSNKDGWAVINNQGQVLTGFVYSGVGDAKGYDLIPVYKGTGFMEVNRYLGIVNKAGNEIARPQYTFVEILSNELAIVAMYDKYGILNSANQLVIPMQFTKEQLKVFTNIQPNGAYLEKGQWKAFSFAGNSLKKWKYDDIRLEGEYLWPVKYRNKWGYVDTLGREIVSTGFDSVGIYAGGVSWVALAGKKGVMDKEGKLVVPVQYDRIALHGKGNYLVAVKGKYGLVNPQGAELLPLQFDAIDQFSENFAAVKLNSKWGFVNQFGKLVITPLYDDALSFSDGLAAVMLNKKVGFINKEGKMVISPQFDSVVESFYKGKAIVSINGQEIYIDATGKEIK